MRVPAFAKINLSLRVLGRRADGYHDLQTIFQSIALHDTLTIRRRAGAFTLTCDDPQCPADRTNLVWRAANEVWRAAGRRGRARGIAIHLEKQIPMQAGLGGGSSDAAAAIRALGRLWRVPRARQRAIAQALGADIPYFFEGGTVLGLDRGDLLFPLADRPPMSVVVVVPNFGVRTKDAFTWHDAAVRPSTAKMRRKADADAVGNDLEPVVARRHPEIGRLLNELRRAGAVQAAMSGSGAAVFGLFTRRTAAARAAQSLGRAGRRVIVTRTLDRRAYQGLAAH
jgi:4-diphosphocytidyl-2-C-methyl-D-erythritol kinase